MGMARAQGPETTRVWVRLRIVREQRLSCACPAGRVCVRHASGTARRRLDLAFVKVRSFAIDADRCIPCFPWKLSSYSFCGLVSRMGGWDTKIFQWQSLFTKSGGSSLWGWPAHRNPKPHGFGLSSTWCGSKRPSCACPAGLVCERHASGTARRRLDLVFVIIRSIAIDADICIPCIPWNLSSCSF